MAKQIPEQLYIGLDIGTSTVRCVVGLGEQEGAMPSVIGVGAVPSAGLRKGAVADVEETVSAITAAVDEAERISGAEIDRATLSIGGAHIASLQSTGVVPVSRTDREVTAEDLVRAEDAATTVSLPANHEILEVIPRSYKVDDQSGVKDPIGMNGVRLEVQATIVTGAVAALKSLERAVYQAGIDIEGRVAGPLAAAEAVLSKRHKELGTAVVVIGAATTGLAVYEEGELVSVKVLPVGAGHITNDLAIGLRTSVDAAEKIKRKYVHAHPTRAELAEKLRIEELDGDDAVIARRDLTRIVDARLDELFTMIRRELAKIGKDGMLPGGVVLTGGGANMPGMAEYAKAALRLPATIGAPQGFGGLTDRVSDPAFSTAIGLMMANMHHAGGRDLANARLGQTVDRIKRTLRNLLP